MSFGGFGQTATQAAPGGFGNSLGLFGQQQQQQPQQQQQQQQQAGQSIFGQQQQPQQQQAGGLFGNNAPATTTTNLFGQQQQQSTANTGGLFGQQQQQQPGTATGGLFGQQQQQQPSTTGGLFGNTTTQPQQQQTGLFGQSTTQQPATGGLFGSANQTVAQQSNAGGLFGAPTQNTQTSLFGASNQQTQQASNSNSLFAPKPTNAPLTLSTLGASSNPAAPSQNQPTPSGSNVQQDIEKIWNSWDPSSPQCRFQAHFYNLVDRNSVGLYGRPANATDEALWQRAVRENPDPSRLVPVIAKGFEDLKKRADAQVANAATQAQALAELNARLDAISQKHSLSTSIRAQKAARAEQEIKQRLTSLVQHLHLLIPTVRSSSIRPEEEALRVALENVEADLQLGRTRGKISELMTAVAALGAMKERARQGGGEGGAVEWAVVDEDGLRELAQILHDEQNGLAHLTKLIKDGTADVELIEAGIGIGGQSRSASMGGSKLGR